MMAKEAHRRLPIGCCYRSAGGESGASEAMVRPRPPATRNSAPPSGTNTRRATPMASFAPDTVFALSERVGNPAPGCGLLHAALTRSAPGRGKELLGDTGGGSNDAL